MRKIARWLVLLFSLLVSLGGAELWMRRQEAATTLVLPWDEPGRRYALKVGGKDVNSQGFNERELPLVKPDGVWRVVVVGDSVTFGGGLAREDTYPRVAERILRERGINAEIINCSVFGYDADQVAATLRHRGWQYAPDGVVYAAYTNDGDPTRLLQLGASMTPIYVGDPGSALTASAQRRSALYRRLMGAVVARQDAGRKMTDDEASARINGALARMAEDARANEVPLMVWGLAAHVLADSNVDTCGGGALGPTFCVDQVHLLRLIGQLVLSQGLPFAHALPALRGGPERAFYLPGETDPHHPNAAGHARIGALFAEVLLAWRDGALASLEAAQLPEEMRRAPVSAPPRDERPREERPRKGLRPPKSPRGAPPRQNGVSSPDP